MKIMLWVVGSILIVIFVLIAAGNASIWFTREVLKKRAASWVPLVGGIIGILGIYTIPLPEARRWWYMPLILDYGCLPGLAHTALWHAARAIKNKRQAEDDHKI